MSQEKRILKAVYRIANEFEGDNFECQGSLVPFLEWFCENIYETNVLSPEELYRLVHLFISGLTFFPRKVNSGNWS